MKNWLRHYWTLLVPLLVLALLTWAAYDRVGIDTSTFFAILIPASVGVIGTYGLYLKRRVDDTRRLRKGLRSELEGMTWFVTWPDEGWGVPPFDPVPSVVYESNAGDLGFLTDREVTHITEFYSRAALTRELLGFHGEMVKESELSPIRQDFGQGDRAKVLVGTIDRLALGRQRALFTLERILEGESSRYAALDEGNVIAPDHPVVDRSWTLCLEYGLLIEEPDGYRVTETGERFFEGEMSARDLEKVEDILGRDQEWYDKVVGRLQRLADRARTR